MRCIFGLALVLVALSATPVHAERVVMSCVLTGPQSVPYVDTPAFGCGRFVIDTQSNTIDYRLSMTDLIGDETAAIIHGPAEPGVATAEHLFSLPFGLVKSGTLVYDEVDEAMILDGSTYVNIHTSAFPLDEIRGQIVDLNCVLDGAQAGVLTTATGWGGFTIDTETNTLSYYIDFEDLEGVETMAHIHGPALHQESGVVVHTLPSGSPKVGSWIYDEGQEEAITNGLMSVNVHSSLHTGGELRGQITPHVSVIDRDQVAPATTSGGAGFAMISIDPATDTLSYAVVVSGLDGTEESATIRGMASPGDVGAELLTLDLGNLKLGSWSYSPDQEDDLLAGLTYVDLRTTTYPDGELRGQLWFGPPVVLFERGDTNADGGIDIGDAVTVLDVLFAGSVHLCFDALDVNDDGAADIADGVYLLSNLFSMGPDIAAPQGGCGQDPTDDSLSCSGFDACP